MSPLFLKPNQYRPVGITTLVIGVAFAVFLYFSPIDKSWMDFVSGLLIGVGIALTVASFSE